MCWMMVKKSSNKINFEAMDKAQKHNSDGYGVAWYEDGFVKTYKTFDYSLFKRVCAALEDFTLVVHLRYATKGDKSYSNIHPFDTPTGVMFHNGTIYGIGTNTRSDSQVLADVLMECTYDNIKDMAPLIAPYIDDKINRLVFFEDRGEVVIMNKHLGITEDNGDWYSNDYHLKDDGWCRGEGCTVPSSSSKHYPWVTPVTALPKKNKVFVYGTLKKGYQNSHLLKDAKLLGKAKTSSKWRMINNSSKSFPYLLSIDKDNGHYVIGEVYEVTDKELMRLDLLEGVPNHYRRATINVRIGDKTELVKTYVKANVSIQDLNEPILEEWRGTKYEER